MRYEAVGFSDKGGFREINQDRIIFLNYEEEGVELPALAAICDGVGGSDHGEIAADMTAQILTEWYYGVIKWVGEHPVEPEHLVTLLRDAIDVSNSEVRKYCETNGKKTASTMSVLLLYKDTYHILHVGDSRIYNLRLLELLTEDEKAFKDNANGGKFYLTNYVGKEEEIQVRYYHGKIRKKDVFILSSDGFYNVFTRDDAKKLYMDILGSKDPSEICRDWVFTAKNRKTRDNVSLVYVRVM